MLPPDYASELLIEATIYGTRSSGVTLDDSLEYPTGIVLKKKVFSHRPRKFPNPRPIHTQGDVNLFTYALVWGERGDFFTLSLKFAPTGVRTQDLRGTAGTA
jgi:hypothetical protein